MSVKQTIQAKSGDKYHLGLAKSYIRSGASSTDILNELKLSKYIVNLNGLLVHINAISVLGLVNGYRLALEDINRSLKSGTHKASKARGLYSTNQTK